MTPPKRHFATGHRDYIEHDQRYFAMGRRSQINWERIAWWSGALAVNFGLWALIIWGVRALLP